jgi:hypothetical protein
MKALSSEKQLAGFIDKFTPEMATRVRAARKKMRELVPGAVEIRFRETAPKAPGTCEREIADRVTGFEPSDCETIIAPSRIRLK